VRTYDAVTLLPVRRVGVGQVGQADHGVLERLSGGVQLRFQVSHGLLQSAGLLDQCGAFVGRRAANGLRGSLLVGTSLIHRRDLLAPFRVQVGQPLDLIRRDASACQGSGGGVQVVAQCRRVDHRSPRVCRQAS
jgi:hypothetical protein